LAWRAEIGARQIVENSDILPVGTTMTRQGGSPNRIPLASSFVIRFTRFMANL
jgi:hypothetical protein